MHQGVAFSHSQDVVSYQRSPSYMDLQVQTDSVNEIDEITTQSSSPARTRPMVYGRVRVPE
ncbi:hypothetical protein HG15A2_12210 [Adhaeretor mobilis]|uniref:Uncharacterized protein n=1 Tax=Adhaeretor mobilis TaxID=1930276 RepID=A0A517MST7_9BACT|nr:hypothetical protein HG15A2_12210 [Adhaeretor mobilis]